MKKKDLIVVRGAGDLATGTIHRLKKAGFRLLVLEAEHPAAIRRQVALSEAVYAGSARVEDVEAVRMDVDLAEKKNRKELLEQEMEQIWKKEIIFITHIIPCKIGNAIQPRKGIIRTNTDRIETTVILRACLIWNIVYFDE